MAQTWSGVIHSYHPGSDFLLHTDYLLYGYNASGYHVTDYLTLPHCIPVVSYN
ncbi:hypothetical protein [Ilyomonas limi]|uniref:hypothetical protein n=1 Tax=Ilyomonas limi TaxID=2575867 RepID=UPI0014852C67|nr:hypothetical protein [Ilyomonas limi]